MQNLSGGTRFKCYPGPFSSVSYRFETKNATFKIEQSPVDGHKLMLTINRQPIGEWFKEQWERLQQTLGNSVQIEKKGRGFRL